MKIETEQSSDNRHYIFHRDDNSLPPLFFDQLKFYNTQTHIQFLELLHFTYQNNNYFYLFARYNSGHNLLIKYNKADDFNSFLLQNNVAYQKYDVIDVQDFNKYCNYHLKDGRIIQFMTFSNGSSWCAGKTIFDITEPKNVKQVAQIPYFKILFDFHDKHINLAWQGNAQEAAKHEPFQNFLRDQEVAKKQVPKRNIINLAIILAIVVFLFWIAITYL